MASVSQRIFFVDASIIVLYQARIREDLISFIENSNHSFFYTESIRKKLQSKKLSIPSNFIFVQSEISEQMKDWSFSFLNHVWLKTSESKGFPRDIERFREDLLIVIEAGSVERTLYNKSFLTSNMRLYNKFFRDKETNDFMRESIALVGLEFPAEINPIDRAIEKWVI
jgi:hypothetical protein